MGAKLKLGRLRSFVVRIKTKSHKPLRHLPVHMVDMRKEKEKKRKKKINRKK